MATAKVQKGKKRSKGKTARGQQKAAIAVAVQALNASHEYIFAIEEVGQWLPQVKEADGIGVSYIVESLCSNLHDCYCEAMDAIAHLKHPATPLILKACEALDLLRLVSDMTKDDGPHPRKHLSALGRVILTFLAESARWMEQATEALGGGTHGFGWLDGLQHVEGVPEGEFKRLDLPRQWLVSEFNKLNPVNQGNAGGFIAELVKSQARAAA